MKWPLIIVASTLMLSPAVASAQQCAGGQCSVRSHNHGFAHNKNRSRPGFVRGQPARNVLRAAGHVVRKGVERRQNRRANRRARGGCFLFRRHR